MENNFNQNTPVPEEPTQDTCQDASQETTAQAAPETAPKPPIKVRRVGTFSLGLMLVAIGAIQLAQIFMPNVIPTRFFLYPKNPSAPFLYHTDVCDWYRTGSVFRHCGCSLCRGKPEISGSSTQSSPDSHPGSPLFSGTDSGADCHFFVRAWNLCRYFCNYLIYLCHYDKADLRGHQRS